MIKSFEEFNEGFFSKDDNKETQLAIDLIEDIKSGEATPIKFHYKSKAYMHVTSSDGDIMSGDDEGYIKTYTYWGVKVGNKFIYSSNQFWDGDDLWVFDKEVNSDNFDNMKNVWKNMKDDTLNHIKVSKISRSVRKELSLAVEILYNDYKGEIKNNPILK